MTYLNDTQLIFLIHCAQLLNLSASAYDETPYNERCFITEFGDDTHKQWRYVVKLLKQCGYDEKDKKNLSELIDGYKEEIRFYPKYDRFKNRLKESILENILSNSNLPNHIFYRFVGILKTDRILRNAYLKGFQP